MKNQRKAMSLALAALTLVGCGQAAAATNLGAQGATQPASVSWALPAQQRAVTGMPVVPLSVRPASASGESQNKGSLSYASDLKKTLSKEQEQLMLDFMHSYYASLRTLEVQNISSMFTSAKSARDVMDIWEVEVEIRKMQKTDLSLRKYAFALTVQSITEHDNGYVDVRITESCSQRFAAYPNVTAEIYQLGHTFTFTRENKQWRLRQHIQFSGANNVLSGRRYGQSSTSYTPVTKADYLAQAKKDTARRGSQGTDPGKVTADHPYDRVAAVAYAQEWVGKRNTAAWRTYDRMGGNCQNFTSQAIHAGGIPMDITSPAQWKWYGDSPNASFAAAGRSSSWTGVNDFLTYVKSNKGHGMVAKANAPFYTGEPGDIIHLGTADGYRHTVMITQVMTDKDGKVVDYLVSSNTADLKNYPISAYHYTNQMLIKIYGWNNA